MKLLTLNDYRRLDPKSQGYAVYMQAEWPGSELKSHQENPYQSGSCESDAWLQGHQIAVLEAQDSEASLRVAKHTGEYLNIALMIGSVIRRSPKCAPDLSIEESMCSR